jgi:hypothetical protein
MFVNTHKIGVSNALNVSGRVYSNTMRDKKTELLTMLTKYARAGIPLTTAEKNLVKYLLSKDNKMITK